MVKRPIAVKAAREFNQATNRGKALVRQRHVRGSFIEIRTESSAGVVPFRVKDIIKKYDTNMQIDDGKLILY